MLVTGGHSSSMAETGPAAIVAALTRAIADDGRGSGATLGGGAPLCPRRRWSCRRVMPEEELVGVVSAARVPLFPLPRCSRLANGCSRTYVASCCVVYRCFTCTVRGSHARRSKRGISGGAGCGGGGGARGQVTAVGQVGRRSRTRAATTPPRSASRRRRLARAPPVAGSRIHVSCSPSIDRAPGWRGRSRFVVAGANTVSWWVLGPPPPPPSPSATRLAARG